MADVTEFAARHLRRVTLQDRQQGSEQDGAAAPRLAAAEAAATAAHILLSEWGVWAMLQAGALAAEQQTITRQATLWECGAGELLENDPASAARTYAALEQLDAATLAWQQIVISENSGGTKEQS